MRFGGTLESWNKPVVRASPPVTDLSSKITQGHVNPCGYLRPTRAPIPWKILSRECKNRGMANARAKGPEAAVGHSTAFSWLHLVIGVGVVASARFAWLYSHADTDTPAPALALLLSELPFAFSLLPFFRGDTSKRCAQSAGIVFGTALTFAPSLLPLAIGSNLQAMGRSGYAAELAKFIPVCFMTALCMLGVSWQYGRDDRSEFRAWAKRGALGFLFVLLLGLLASLL